MIVNAVVSLGYNCEVSFRIQDYFGKINSTIYSWAYIGNRERFIKSLTETEKLATSDKELLPWGMIRSIEYEISFHSKFSSSELFNPDGSENKENVMLANQEMASRYTYLANKFNKLLSDNQKTTLYICKMQPWITDENENKQFISMVYTTMSKLCNAKNFVLLFVFEKKVPKGIEKLQNDNLKIKYVKEFAPDSNTKYGGDIEGWNFILSDYELVEQYGMEKHKSKKQKMIFKQWLRKISFKVQNLLKK